MYNQKNNKIGAAIITLLLIGSFLFLPVSGMISFSGNYDAADTDVESIPIPTRKAPDNPLRYDTIYNPDDETYAKTSLQTGHNDGGYNTDAGDQIVRYMPIYIGEPDEETVPGRSRAGTLDVDNGDTDDWYGFFACEGQTIDASVSGDVSFELCDSSGHPVEGSLFVEKTGRYFFHVFTDGVGGDYTFDITYSGQNDAGTGGDAGNDINSATAISPGEYNGYMSSDDVEDWYSFEANAGDGITVYVKPLEKSDYDIHLYNPSGEYVHSAEYYGEDTLEYPADASGTWKIQLDMFPGWDTSKWPDNYFLYGSGPYELELTIGGSVEAPPGPIPQYEITPVAQTFTVNYDEDSIKDDFAYLAAVPAANYLENGERFLSPIVYQGCDYNKLWFTDVDQTTQYFLDDWNTYLDRHGMVAEDYQVPDDPIQAAASIAADRWSSSDAVVVVPDGSAFEDSDEILVEDAGVMQTSTSVTSISSDDPNFESGIGYTVFANGDDICAIQLTAYDIPRRIGSGPGITLLGNIFPNYINHASDWWPVAYDTAGDANDLYMPIIQKGVWTIGTELGGGDFSTMDVTKIAGKRYPIDVTDSDSTLEVEVTTPEESNLMIFLADPDGNIRAPRKPHNNGGEIEPIHHWNGGHWEHNFDEFRDWKVEPHTTFSTEVHYPVEGTWTAILVPYINGNQYREDSYNGDYEFTATLRKHNEKRVNAGLSAANGAVIASMNHAPMLYVTETDVPSATSDAIASLGATNIIYVNIGDVSSADPGADTKYTTLQSVIDAIKAEDDSENFITITSFATGDGYFAPSAMAAAYHGSPVLHMGEAQDAYDYLGKAATWREYAGDYYHGTNSVGHLPHLNEPTTKDPDTLKFWFNYVLDVIRGNDLPSIGLDKKKDWFLGIHDGIYDMIDGYGLDLDGKENYLFVSDRDSDIRDLVGRAMTGNNSIGGHIPVPTAPWASAHILRNIMYPALIYANPGRDVTTSQLMNFPDPFSSWTTNDGTTHRDIYSSRVLKEGYSSHGRFYEGHSIWENMLERYNSGASICYYAGHGTGGSGISAQWKNIAEQFPYVELKHEHLLDFEWWDGWRGYMYDDQMTKTPRSGGFTWYNAIEPNLYDLIHFKWVDQQFDNLHSIADLWMSCTTASHLGPLVYLAHGAVFSYGNGGTGLCPQADLMDDEFMYEMMVHGTPLGEAFSKQVWLHQRDYTTGDPTAMYGRSSLSVTNVQMLFGDPTFIPYSPEWTEPTPITP